MSTPEYEPAVPVEGGRVYTGTSPTELSLQSSNPDSGYYAANELLTAVETNLSETFRSNMAAAGIDVFGFEFLVNPRTDGPAFEELSGAVGLSIFWLTDPPDFGAEGPHVYLFARQGSSGAEAIGPTPTPGGGTTTRLFVASFADEDAEVTAETWLTGLEGAGVDAAGGTGGLLDGTFSLSTTSGSLTFFGGDANWYGFTSGFTAEPLPEGGVTLTRGSSSYEHDAWLLAQLGIEGQPAAVGADVPEHDFYYTRDGRIPEWAGDVDPAAALERYGGTELHYQLSAEGVQRLQADLWELGFWFPGMIQASERGNYSFEPGNESTLTVEDASGTFGIETEWALREFQVYARMATVARFSGTTQFRYVEGLGPTANARPYAGGVHGVLTAETAVCLRHWLDNDYRCPVVVEAFEDASDLLDDVEAAATRADLTTLIHDSLAFQNIWRRLEVDDTDPRMFVTDFSGYYDVPAPYDDIRPPYEISSTSADAYVDEPGLDRGYVNIPDVDTADPATRPAYVLGGYFDYHLGTRPGGPGSTPRYGHCWPVVGEVLPENVLPPGTDGDPPTLATLVADAGTDAGVAARLSTFAVVRAASEQENRGYLDSVNSYDGAVASLGPCHWTLSITGERLASYPSGWSRARQLNAVTTATQELYGPGGDRAAQADDPLQAGELPAFFAYFRSAYPDDFRTALRAFGLDVATRWGDDGGALFTGQGKYQGRVSLLYQGGSGSDSLTREPLHRRDADYLRTWHWLYRLVMGGRTVDGFRRAMWDLSRARLRDLRTAQWLPAANPSVTHLPTTVEDGTPRRARTGEVFTSQRATAILLRWHIRTPAHVVESGDTASEVVDAFEAAWGAGWGTDLTAAGWSGATGDARESSLIAELAAQATADTSVGDVRNWPTTWIAWQSNATRPCHYALDVSQLGTPTNPLLDDDRGSFSLDTSVIGDESPTP